MLIPTCGFILHVFFCSNWEAKNIFSIYNSGEQIDTKNLFIVFDKYFQEDSSKDGFGLGLAMVKEFCDKNKIAINIDTLENGNRFNLNLKNIIKWI